MGKTIQKPEGLSEGASRFWDEHQEAMQSILNTYIHIAQTQDIEGFQMLNMFISICSQHCVYMLNTQDGPTQ